jgi:2-polyprenyl-6-methoxyphenol hydroxylase-like FAD-dependent oxidoreductase
VARIVTIGGSVGGLAAALFLARRGHEVTVLERDADPAPEGAEEAFARWQRRGVPHLRGTHMFSTRGVNVLRKAAPDVLDALRAAGGREVPVDPSGDRALVRLGCRRTTFELALRRVALDQAGVRFLPGTEVTGLEGTRGGDNRNPVRVTGVRTRRGEHLRADLLTADLVVDASGRLSRLRAWLEDLGGAGAGPAAETFDSGMSVHTRWYRLLDGIGSPEPPQVLVDLGYTGAILAPADNRTFSVTFGVFGRDPALLPLRRPAGHEAAIRSVPALARWVAPDVSEPLDGRIRFLGHLPNHVRRLVVDGRPVATGVVALGDAAVCTNPRFGRGISLALVQAPRSRSSSRAARTRKGWPGRLPR